MSYNIGGVKLPYVTVEIPKYRGVFARVVELDCPAENYEPLKDLAAGLGGKATYFEITAPGGPGNNASPLTVRIEGIYILRVVKVSVQTCVVQFADKRLALTRRVSDKDFRVKFGDGFLNGTDFSTYQSAIRELVASIDVLRGNVAGGAYADFLNGNIRDQQHLAGMSLPLALDALLEESSNSLTVWNDGFFRFPGKEDLDAIGKLPQKTAYSWHTEPGWEALDSIVLGTPRKIHNYYNERHCLRMQGTDPAGHIVLAGDPELQIELEQVYSDGGTIYTLSELLAANDIPTDALTDSFIASLFWTETFAGSGLGDHYGTANFDRVHAAIRDGWRRLWRIKYSDAARGRIGGWTEWDFGKINADGSVIAVAVECKWVEFLTELAVKAGDPVIGAPMTINHDSGTSPFAVQWEGDASSGVIRMVQRDKLRGGIALPGELKTPLTLKRDSSAVVTDGDQAFKLDNFIVIERQDISRAIFQESFEIAIYACATKRMPNTEKRWHVQETPTNIDAADIGFIELAPSGDLMCVRDYVSAGDSQHLAQADGYGPILNETALREDAERRTEGWKLTHAAALDGFAIAESIQAFQDLEVRGPINEIVLQIEGQVVRTRIVAGNLGNAEQRERKAAKWLAERKFKTAGAK